MCMYICLKNICISIVKKRNARKTRLTTFCVFDVQTSQRPDSVTVCKSLTLRKKSFSRFKVDFVTISVAIMC